MFCLDQFFGSCRNQLGRRVLNSKGYPLITMSSIFCLPIDTSTLFYQLTPVISGVLQPPSLPKLPVVGAWSHILWNVGAMSRLAECGGIFHLTPSVASSLEEPAGTEHGGHLDS